MTNGPSRFAALSRIQLVDLLAKAQTHNPHTGYLADCQTALDATEEIHVRQNRQQAAVFRAINALTYHEAEGLLDEYLGVGRKAGHELEVMREQIMGAYRSGKIPAEDLALPRFVVSAGWGHIFSGQKEEITRWVYDTAAEVLHAQVASGPNFTAWSDLDWTSKQDLLESIRDNDALENPEAHGLVLQNAMPDWALASLNMQTDVDVARPRPRQ